jgi:selenoprotein W-related protein
MTARPAKVSITYCAECGYGPEALALAGSLIKTFGYRLSSIELIPWHEGSFDVAIGDHLIHSMYREGGFPEHDDVINAIRKRLATAE